MSTCQTGRGSWHLCWLLLLALLPGTSQAQRKRPPYQISCDLMPEGQTCGNQSSYQVRLQPDAGFVWPKSAPMHASHVLASNAFELSPATWQQTTAQVQADGQVLWQSAVLCEQPTAVQVTSELVFFLCDSNSCQRYKQQVTCPMPMPPQP